MGNNPARVLEECIARLRQGESVEDCLAKYPEMRSKIESLLNMVHSVYFLPRVSPSDKFQRAAKARLMSRIRQQSAQERTIKSKPGAAILDGLRVVSQKIWQPVLQAKKVAIPVTMAVMVILALIFSGVHYFTSPTPALASQSTLNILSGTVEIQDPGEDKSQRGNDGDVLDAGTRVKTGSDSHALLTFFEGSTIKLEPDTIVEIQKVELTDGKPTTIVLTQWLGRTWSRVVKMTDPGSHYRIETPSATAIVRGTLFSTEVEEAGGTRVATTEGLVSVIAQGEEVYLPANLQTHIETGAVPSLPETLPDPKSEVIITIDMPAIGSVTDPNSSSTGMLPDGESYNQILGSQASSPFETVQMIHISEPIDGEYIITLRYLDEGVAGFNIQGKSEGVVIFEYKGKWGGSKVSGWLIHLNLNVDGGYITGGEISIAGQMGDKSPEKGIPHPAEGNSGPDEPSETESATSGDTANDEGPDEDDGTSTGESEDDDKDTKGGTGKPDDKEDKDDKVDKDEGIPGDTQDDKGRPEDKKDKKDKDEGIPGDTQDDKGKPEDKKDKKDKDDKGKPDDEKEDRTGNVRGDNYPAGGKKEEHPNDNQGIKDQQ